LKILTYMDYATLYTLTKFPWSFWECLTFNFFLKTSPKFDKKVGYFSLKYLAFRIFLRKKPLVVVFIGQNWVYTKLTTIGIFFGRRGVRSNVILTYLYVNYLWIHEGP
jgi:hypothetical protein